MRSIPGYLLFRQWLTMRKNLIFMALHFIIAKSKVPNFSHIRALIWLNAFPVVYANSLLATWVNFDFVGLWSMLIN